MPSSTWCFSPCSRPRISSSMACGLIALRLELRRQLERTLGHDERGIMRAPSPQSKRDGSVQRTDTPPEVARSPTALVVKLLASVSISHVSSTKKGNGRRGHAPRPLEHSAAAPQDAGGPRPTSGTVAFLGLGGMGRPMAARLVEAGFAVRVYNRTRGPEKALAKLGATACAHAARVRARAPTSSSRC